MVNEGLIKSGSLFSLAESLGRDMNIIIVCINEPNLQPIIQMIQRQSVYKRIQIQRLLDEQSRLEGELNELEGKIEERELEYLSNSWMEGDYLLGWHKMETMAAKRALNISPKDKKFSLSSVFSRPSQQLLSLEVKRLVNQKSKGQQKKKKGKKSKSKGKINKRRRVHRKKK